MLLAKHGEGVWRIRKRMEARGLVHDRRRQARAASYRIRVTSKAAPAGRSENAGQSERPSQGIIPACAFATD
jgi:hypothetical protein